MLGGFVFRHQVRKFLGKSGWERNGFDSIGSDCDVGGGDGTFSDECFVAGDQEAVTDGADADFGNEKSDRQEIAEAGRGAVVAGGMDSWPASFEAFELAVDFVVDAAQESVFAGFHVAEEIREMDEAGHVGFIELDATLDFEGGDVHGMKGATVAKKKPRMAGTLSNGGWCCDIY